MAAFKMTEEQYLKTLRKLEAGGDWCQILGQGSLIAMGGAAGGFAAPAIWGVLGFAEATIPAWGPLGWIGLTSSVAVATPYVLIGGLALGGAGIAYGLGKLLFHKGRISQRQDYIKNGIKDEILRNRIRLKEKWTAFIHEHRQQSNEEQHKALATLLREAFEEKIIPLELGSKIILKVTAQEISTTTAFDVLEKLISCIDGDMMPEEFARRQAEAMKQLLDKEETIIADRLKTLPKIELRRELNRIRKSKILQRPLPTITKQDYAAQ